jgi:RHS repeat-associated protein
MNGRPEASDGSAKQAGSPVSAPTISLPKGGGAIRGIGEKFAANPVTGTGSMTVPIATSPGRSGFGPQLALSYDSGAGNGPFGFGWSLSLPSITRKTDKGLPRYLESDPADSGQADVFILSGAEDLVPVLVPENKKWVLQKLPNRTVNGIEYRIQRFRPRIEGLFARIERWTNLAEPADVFWRSISRDNITTWYGKSAESRIADPSEPARIFSWLICQTHDDKGNVIVYRYKPEDSTGVDLALSHERNRNDQTRSANRYLKRICYGNRVPYLPILQATAPWPEPPGANALDASQDWLFEVVCDYEEHDVNAPTPIDAGAWSVRNDPFSSYRAGFEVRTYRLCQRVLMFHHIPSTEADATRNLPAFEGYEGLVRSTDFDYSYEGNPKDARNPIYSFLLSVAQIGYKRQTTGNGYRKKSLPPVEFTYSEARIQEEIREVASASLENLPYGLDGSNYQWVDLDGEGLSGVLSEQADGWFYKRNLSPINTVGSNGSERVEARFGPVELVASKPVATLARGQAQFMDLAGDGQPDLVQLEGPVRGFYERTEDADWEPFRPFPSFPNVDTRDPNLKFIDLDGDGHADILISEDEVFRWHPSLAEDGYGPSQSVPRPWDEEKGPALVFADPTQSIFLADMSGDGLADICRIRNGEVCYWPNLGYGRFGAKVTMDNSTWFDSPDLFDQRRIRVADIDGSGTADIIYLHGDGLRIFFNQSGNSWSPPHLLPAFRIDNVASVQTLDLLGNGTACLVWSSPLPGDARRQMRYIDLMGGQKPHLLMSTKNNLGADTIVSYAPSTKFYIADKLAGNPWVTKLPFPVHCVEKVTVTDKWRQTSFSTTYSYHHGYFDGPEREFRGFGRVEQVDVESFGKFAQGNSASPYITDDKTLYQPPVKTVTWYHTGAMLEEARILSHFAHEYFPRWFEDLRPEEVNVLGDFKENALPEPEVEALDSEGNPQELSVDEWRESLRACKGMMLRQEVYELDVDALDRGEHRPIKLFTTAYHNCHVRILQPRPPTPIGWESAAVRADHQHAVFLVAESEAITYHYELDLTSDTVRPDPRIAHTLNLKFDDYANVLQSVAAAYARLGHFKDDADLAKGLDATLPLIDQVQRDETHLAYTENRYTSDFDENDAHRLHVLCEVLTFELTGIKPSGSDGCFTLGDLRRLRLSPDEYQTQASDPPKAKPIDVEDILYHEIPNRSSAQKRLVEHVRMLFFKDDLSDPLPFRHLGRLGLLYETYKLALTDKLLETVFKDGTGNKLDQTFGGITARARLNNAKASGYLSGALLAARFPNSDTAGRYWIRSGIAGFAPDAAQHFYPPKRYTDPFDNVTSLEYDSLDLFVASSTDALTSTTRVTRFDFGVLAPSEMQDINDNLSEVFFDTLGLPTAMALKGKGNEGDNLTGFSDALANPQLDSLVDFFTAPKPYDEAQCRGWLGTATARHIYYFGETQEKLPDGGLVIRWARHPSCACGILRERHVAALGPGEQSPLQSSFEYSDGMGTVLVKRIQAEPDANGKPLRWVANGKTILNNKGKPVKQYEPYFSSSGHRFEEPREEGVTPVIYYDAVGRSERTEFQDGSFSRVEFSPWHVRRFDQNDTVRESKWFSDRNPPDPDQPLPINLITGKPLVTPEQRAAWLAAQHADTPALTILDSLGREVISIAHNRVKDDSGIKDEKHVTFTKLDAEGKPLWVRDARGNLVLQYVRRDPPDQASGKTLDQVEPTTFIPAYDIAGNLLFQHSMDAGDRWMLNDAAGKPTLAWNSRGYAFLTEYDSLHRPIRSFVQGGNPADENSEFFPSDVLFERIIHGEQLPQAKQLNLRGKPLMHFDSAGLVTNTGLNRRTNSPESYDFNGNLLHAARRLAQQYSQTVNWKPVDLNVPTDPTARLDPAALAPAFVSLLESETFTTGTTFDALSRPVSITTPDQSETRHIFNEANLLERIDVRLRGAGEWTPFVTNIDYNAKGQRILIEYGNGVRTSYEYDPFTFRLTRLLTERGVRFASDWPQPPDPPRGGMQNLNYFYDPVGNITDVRDDAQQTIFFNGQKVEPSNSYEYDALYRLVSATGREHIGQNAFPQATEDDGPRTSQPLATDSAAMRIYTQKYEYDSVGNILGMIHFAGPNGSWTRCYQYALDSNRLLSTSLPGDPHQPVYAAQPGYAAKYPHDLHGNMAAMPHLSTMEWNFKDQLQLTIQQAVKNALGERTYYVYGAGGQRVRKVTETLPNAIKKERIYLGGFELYREYNGGSNATLERETLHVMDDRQRITLIETRTKGDDPSPLQLVRFQLVNHLGSAALELDQAAKVISYEEYHPYGTTSFQAVAQTLEAATKRYRYTGEERDDESGLNYHAARYLAVWLGRWTSCDPVGPAGGTNLYRYAAANPVGLVDPGGREPKAPVPVPRHTPFNFVSESPSLNNWQRAVQEVLEPEFGGGSIAENLRRFEQRVAQLPSGTRSAKSAAQGYASSTYDKVREQFYINEADKPSFNYTTAESELLAQGRPPSATRQLHHVTHIKNDPTQALRAGNIVFTEAGETGGLNRGTPHYELHHGTGARRLQAFQRTQTAGLAKAQPTAPSAVVPSESAAPLKPAPALVPEAAESSKPALVAESAYESQAVASAEKVIVSTEIKSGLTAARNEAGMLARVGGFGGLVPKALWGLNIYFAYDAYKQGTEPTSLAPIGSGRHGGSTAEGILNAVGSLLGGVNLGTELREFGELGSAVDPNKLWNGIRYGCWSPTTLGMGIFFGAFR